jgi:hypothetical protein
MDIEAGTIAREVREVNRRLKYLDEIPLGPAEIKRMVDSGELEEVAENFDLAENVAQGVVGRRVEEKAARSASTQAAAQTRLQAADVWGRWVYAKMLATVNYASAWGGTVAPVDLGEPTREDLRALRDEVAAACAEVAKDDEGQAAELRARRLDPAEMRRVALARRRNKHHELAFAVQEFRSAHDLDEQLLDPSQVEQWVRTQAEMDGPAREVGQFVMDASGSPVGDPIEVEQLMLAYKYRDGSRWRRGEVPVNPGGVLDELRLLSDVLARRLRWRPEDAATFVVSKVVPQVEALTSRLVQADNGTMIEVRADAELDADLVAGEFIAARKRLMERRGVARIRSHRLTADSIELVIWSESKSHSTLTPKAKWEKARRSDNEMIRKKAKAGTEASKLFQRSVRKATRRVLHGIG